MKDIPSWKRLLRKIKQHFLFKCMKLTPCIHKELCPEIIFTRSDSIAPSPENGRFLTSSSSVGTLSDQDVGDHGSPHCPVFGVKLLQITEGFKLTVQAGNNRKFIKELESRYELQNNVKFLLFLNNIHDYETTKIEL